MSFGEVARMQSPRAPVTRKPSRSEVQCNRTEPNPISQRQQSAVSWSNHLSAEATRIKLELERAARAGDPPTSRLQSDWRERMEDGLWALLNSPEFIFIP